MNIKILKKYYAYQFDFYLKVKKFHIKEISQEVFVANTFQYRLPCQGQFLKKHTKG